MAAHRRHRIDIHVPDVPGDDDYVYPTGIGSGIPGQTVVKATDGKL